MEEKTIDFISYVVSLKKRHGISDTLYEASLSKFLVSNGWLGKDIYYKDGQLYTSEDFIAKNGRLLDMHAQYYHLPDEEKNRLLYRKLKTFAPETANLFRQYSIQGHLEEETVYIILDFLCFFLPGELHESTDREIGTLMENGFDSLSKVYGDILADYINWTKRKIKTIYNNTYFMQSYGSRESESAAYSEGKYLLLIYYLFNEEYIVENNMYSQAAQSKNYVDTWLFLSLHCICSLRNTDLIRLPHPKLPVPAEDVLAQVEAGTFSDSNAKACLYSILYTLDVTRNVPNKTKDTSGVPDIKLTVPQSIVTHMGTLFAVAEAHNQIYGVSPDKPLIRIIPQFRKIQKYMGDEIGELFIEADFHSRSANKSFLQMIYIMTDQVNDSDNDEFRVKGYILAALARSHKGGYGEFAKTTSIYLKDAKMSGYSPEFVARELMERGVLSCVADMLLKMVCGDTYEQLSTENQTKAIQALNFSPLDAEKAVQVMQKAKTQAVSIAKEIYASNSRETILKLLHRLGNGEAQSKQNGCLCLMTAIGQPCIYHDRYHSCMNCQYEISTTSTIFILMTEYRRLRAEYKATDNQKIKAKNHALAQNVVVPAISEILNVMREKYGENSIVELNEIIEKVIPNE